MVHRLNTVSRVVRTIGHQKLRGSAMSMPKEFDFIVGGSADGTHLQGDVYTTREDLIIAFGRPLLWCDAECSIDKVTTEWVITFSDGLVATIYDWKRYELGAPRLNEDYSWHIGGTDPEVVRRVVAHSVEATIARGARLVSAA